MDNKGQFGMQSMIAVVVGLILLSAFVPLVNSLVGTVAAANMSNLSMSSTIITIVGMSGIFLLVGFVLSIFGQPNQPQY